MKTRLLSLSIFALLFLVGNLVAEFRTFTNDEGVSVEAELLSLSEDGKTVSIKLRNGRSLDALLSAFGQKDQKFIKEWWAQVQAEKQLLTENKRLRISAKLNRKSTGNRYKNYNWADDKTKAFFPEVVIENEEGDTFKENTVRVVIVATDERHTDRRLIVSATTLETDLPYREKTVLESDPFRLRLYEYNSSYSGYEYKYGYAYEGYIVVVKNSKGEITHSRASKSKYLTNMKAILNCKAGEIYDDGIDRKINAVPNSYYVQ